MTRPRRSVLFMPGSNSRALKKARDLPTDGLIFDLEDAVSPDAKVAARFEVSQSVAAGGFGRREVLVRTNGLDTPWGQEDLEMVAKVRPDGIVLPKVSRQDDLAAIVSRLADLGATRDLSLWAMIETPLAVLNVQQIANQARDASIGLVGLIIGPNDIARETRLRQVAGRLPMLPALTHCIFVARAFGLDVLDGVYNNFTDLDGFAKECTQSRDLGFDGKTLIHPSQIDLCNAAFTPTSDEVAHARDILRAFALPENALKGAIQIGGQMVERLHTEMAERVVAIADAIGLG
ncbi:CoA ester lyase [Bradyrhizobium manausense]|uniref:HpcH/HpaI aldolase/citrate lyase family protein n=1 Tax=Bradyrhizobium manausense TaxID=989370 RepID=UPI001BAC5702|nr:CoA ester lyase [Bradyrhizobium manausense]MBR0834808.1 CoA ester lyase [Bradyrhizobium manausense]